MEQDQSIAQDKVLILYVLKAFQNDITESDLFKLIYPVNSINYFYFRHILADLVSSNLIGTYIKEEESNTAEPVYKITSEGIKSLELTIDVLPGLMRLNADTTLKNELNHITSEEAISTEFIPENEHSYIVKCKIMENNKPLFEIRTFAGSSEQAKLITNNWQTNAYNIYPKMLELLTQKNENNKNKKV